MNCYEFDLVRRNGISMASDQVSLRVYDYDLVSAEERAKKQNRKNRWHAPKVVLLNVELDLPPHAAFGGAHRVVGTDRPTVWYCNHKAGLNLRIG